MCTTATTNTNDINNNTINNCNKYINNEKQLDVTYVCIYRN